METPVLSIYIATFNHERYIARALDSVLMQKTKYSYEVLVGEDASTDGTRAILQDYEARYPGKFTMFYRQENMHKMPLKNGADLRRRCRGKYIIALEGDDFWTDENKLEKQIDFLESHGEYVAVAHNCVVVGEDSLPNGETYPECKDAEYTLRHYASEIMPGQLATVMYRNYQVTKYMDASILEQGLTPGDRLLYFALATNGRVYCMQEVMSAYRHITTHGSSFSATYQYHFEREERWSKALLQYAMAQNNPLARKYAKLIYFRTLIQGIRQKGLRPKEFFTHLKNIDAKCATFLRYVKSYVAKHIFKKNLWV